jgi:hypothetical protein
MIERNAGMHEPDFWTSYAEAMEMSIEGNRLLARKIAELLRNLWRRAIRSVDVMIQGLGQHRHLPPV